RVAAVADRVAALVRLQGRPRAERRLAVLMPDYPGAPGRSGYAVGLDVPASVVALLGDLEAAGYDVRDAPEISRALLDGLGKACAAGDCPPLQGEGNRMWAGHAPNLRDERANSDLSPQAGRGEGSADMRLPCPQGEGRTAEGSPGWGGGAFL